LTRLILCLLLLLSCGGGCSVRRYALNQVSDALSRSGSTFARDDDPDLVKAAVPFSLKLIESLLAENPRHRGLLLAATSGFTQYAFAFVQEDADEVEAQDLSAAEALRARARRLYLRAHQYGLRGLEVQHPGITQALMTDPKAAVAVAGTNDVPFLYWTATAWAAAISLAKDNPDLIGQLPAVQALIDRALQLNEAYGKGAIHSFLVSYEMSRPAGAGDPAARARQQYERALMLSGGQDAGVFVALAEAVTIQKQDLKEFESLLNHALAVPVEASPETRMLNLVWQRRARWLLSRKAELFLIDKPEDLPSEKH
jgi:predicted anti-sigma-YlaC factor YlaD